MKIGDWGRYDGTALRGRKGDEGKIIDTGPRHWIIVQFDGDGGGTVVDPENFTILHSA